MSKQSKSKWRLDGNKVTSDADYLVCEFPYPIYPASQPDEYSDNARLIAAAPEMLSALEEVATEAERLGIGTDDWVSGVDAVDLLAELLPVLQSAIAKARGKS